MKQTVVVVPSGYDRDKWSSVKELRDIHISEIDMYHKPKECVGGRDCLLYIKGKEISLEEKDYIPLLNLLNQFSKDKKLSMVIRMNRDSYHSMEITTSLCDNSKKVEVL